MPAILNSAIRKIVVAVACLPALTLAADGPARPAKIPASKTLAQRADADIEALEGQWIGTSYDYNGRLDVPLEKSEFVKLSILHVNGDGLVSATFEKSAMKGVPASLRQNEPTSFDEVLRIKPNRKPGIGVLAAPHVSESIAYSLSPNRLSMKLSSSTVFRSIRGSREIIFHMEPAKASPDVDADAPQSARTNTAAAVDRTTQTTPDADAKQDANNPLWLGVALSHLIVTGTLEVPVESIRKSVSSKKYEYVALKVRCDQALKGRANRTISVQWYTKPSKGEFTSEQIIAHDGKKAILFLIQSDEKYNKGAYFFSGDTSYAVLNVAAQRVAGIRSEVNTQRELLRDFAKNFPAEKEPLYDKVKRLLDATTCEDTQQAAFQDLEALGSEGVPAMIMLMDDRRLLGTNSISLRNPPGHWEGIRHYGPKTVTDAVTAILNQITGEHFGFIYNGGSERERRENVNGWRIYLYHSKRRKAARARPKEPNQAIGKLIEALASPNRAPEITGPKDDEQRAVIPGSYDRTAQRKVFEAWESLLDAGVVAFPALVERANDPRYSCTLAHPDGDCNSTVGGVCQRILRNQIDGPCCKLSRDYGPNTIQRRAAFKAGFYADLPMWWRNRQHRPLADLQIESAGLALEILKAEADKAGGDNRTRRLETMRELDTLIGRIKASGDPIAPAGIESRYERMIGLPGKDPNRGHPGGPHSYRLKGKPAATP